MSCAVEVDETYVGGNAPGVHGRQTEKNELDDSVPFAAEKALIAGLKQAFLVVAGSAVQKYMDRIKDEREESAANRLPPFIGLIFKEFHSPGTNIHNTH